MPRWGALALALALAPTAQWVTLTRTAPQQYTVAEVPGLVVQTRWCYEDAAGDPARDGAVLVLGYPGVHHRLLFRPLWHEPGPACEVVRVWWGTEEGPRSDREETL